jgi:hypothetical protein
MAFKLKNALGGGIVGGFLGDKVGGLFGKKGPANLYTGPVLPDWLSQGGQDYFQRSQQLAQQPFQQFRASGQTNWTPDQQAGANMLRTNAQSWAAPTQNSMNLFNDTVSGKFLDIGTNPAWAANSGRIVDTFMNSVRPQTDAQFARANAFGGGNSAYEQIVGQNNRSLADSLGSLAGNLYTTERGNQMNALSMFPSMFQASQAPGQSLFNLGEAAYNNQMADYNRQTQDPMARLNFLGQSFSNVLPGFAGQTQPNPNQRSGFADALGGAASGAGIGFMMGGPMGAGIGAGLGGLGGLAS